MKPASKARFLLALITSSALGENIDNNEIKDIYLGNLITTKKYFTYQEGNTISSNTLDSIPSNSGDITSTLKMLPNVQYNNSQLSSQTPGEIDPANISISGGLYYQNNFQIDGFNMNNDLNPSISGDNYNPVAITALPGQSQGLNIDISLLDSISVQDSNISAVYGGFSGGVIEANTKKPTKEFGAKISYQITQGDANPSHLSLTNYHINDNNINNFLNSTSAANQPSFIKHIFRSSLESKFNSKAGIIASFTTTQSFIPLNSYAQSQINAILDKRQKTQKRQSYNLFLKGNYDVSDYVRLEASYAYMPQYNNYFIVNTKDSNFDMLSGGHQAGVKTFIDHKFGYLKIQGNFNFLDNSRTKSQNNMYIWRYSTDKNWNPNGNNAEGGYGNVNSRQINMDLKMIQDFKALKYEDFENLISIGLELGYANAYYKRLNDTMIGFGNTQPLKNNVICSDTQWCSNGIVDINKIPVNQQTQWKDNNGQWISRATLYKAGKIQLHNFTFGSFIEDNINLDLYDFGEIQSRIGLRLDYDTYMSKATLAPRFSINYNAPWGDDNFDTQFTFGANRYYGRNLFAFRLMEERSALQWTLNRTQENQNWENATATQNKSDTNFKQLNVPYSDELVGGISQNLQSINLAIKYIYRNGRDEVRRMCQAPDGSISAYNCASNTSITKDLKYVYTNNGISQSNIVSITLQNKNPLELYEIKNNILFAFDWTNTNRNYANYNSDFELGEFQNDLISYNGKIIRYADRPAENFIRPYTLRLNTIHSLNIWKTKWTWNNFFRYRSGYNAMISVGEEYKDSILINGVLTKVDTFKPYKVKGAFTWDIRLGAEFEIYKRNIMFVNLDVINVLDSKNIAIVDLSNYTPSAGASATPIYELGRQFYIELGYKF